MNVKLLFYSKLEFSVQNTYYIIVRARMQLFNRVNACVNILIMHY